MLHRTASLLALCALICLAAGVGCSDRKSAAPPHDSGPGFDAGTGDSGGSDLDAGGGDGALDYRDARPVDPCLPGCGPTELCGMGDGDGLDNDCDNMVDEDCVCTPGTSRNCFVGPPDRRNVGSCADGTMTCTEFTRWGTCSGGQFPTAEVCDGADNDCNLVNDDGLTGCSSTLTCPGSERAAPLTRHLLRGSAIYTGAPTSWHWTVECPGTVGTCPAPADPNASDTEIFFVSSGNYRVRLEIVLADGTHLMCDWIVYVQGTGLRVELNWDTQGSAHGDTDVDLHLHRRSVPDGVATGETAFFNDDDCYYANCKASSFGLDAVHRRWALPDTTDLAACRDAPHGEGAEWVALGACYNPRLDVDVIFCDSTVTAGSDPDFCAPENINVDNPAVGSSYRIMVNYFSAHSYSGDTHPTVNIYCNGELRGAFGADPLVTLRSGGGSGATADNWLVADVIFFAAGAGSCGATECMVNPIGIVQRGPAFGVDWSF